MQDYESKLIVPHYNNCLDLNVDGLGFLNYYITTIVGLIIVLEFMVNYMALDLILELVRIIQTVVNLMRLLV